MAGLFELNTLTRRLSAFVERDDRLRPEAAKLLEEAAIPGEINAAKRLASRDCPSALRDAY